MVVWVNSIILGRSPSSYCTLTLIAMQGHQKNSENKNVVVHHQTWYVVIIYCYIGYEDEVTTWYYRTQLIEVVKNTYDLG